ncbi:unnamed protein product [Leptosia nina]|uniref:Uncharacterized protein n=1 Tax=Leptosia nina TaxID=320188 RepID=A0AAV1J497_9NEOP
MHTDDISDKECEFEEGPDDNPNITKKSVSTVGFRNNSENVSARPMALRATQSFTGAVEELRFCSNMQGMNIAKGMDVSSTPKSPPVCPCGCLLRPTVTGPFRTREKNTLALHVVPPEVLNHHGYNFEPNDIAMFWKKDCRIFLWKGRSKIKKTNSKNKVM